MTSGIDESLVKNTNEKLVSEPKTEKKKKKIRCNVCKRKLGLLGFECKCGLMFCSAHLIPEQHNCDYDFKNEQCKRLEKTLVKVVSSKVPPI